ncbi:hypothetical protein FGG08_005418 [Glutinoglossum americanum]|uniref:Uncharacterized protein n=1 Tax=Glutinoglossum americanum TaxID=1670608 RepID=A0A9P8I398_9PEZI|nr:hypothetical protein FGG08_005418 [Glutinoglossum americanum]
MAIPTKPTSSREIVEGHDPLLFSLDSNKVHSYRFGTRSKISIENVITPDPTSPMSHVVVIPTEQKRSDVKMHGSRRDIARLVEIWDLPLVVTRFLLAHSLTTDDLAFRNLSFEDHWLSWYTVPLAAKPFYDVNLRVVHVINHDNYQVNSLIQCPIDMVDSLSDLLAEFCDNTVFREASTQHLLRLELSLLRFAFSLAEGRFIVVVLAVEAVIIVLCDTDSKTISEDRFVETQNHMSALGLEIGWQEDLQHLMSGFEKHATSLGGAVIGELNHYNLPLQELNNLREHSLSIMKKFTRHREVLGIARETVSSTLLLAMFLVTIQLSTREQAFHRVELNHASYTLKNTIEVRKMTAESNREAEQMQRLTRVSQEDSHEMRKLAYLTMLYLPATFAATFFSMPFFSMGDDLTFRALKRLWIYFVVCTLLTSTTFAASHLWSLREKPISKTPDPDQEQQETVGASNILQPPVVPQHSLEDLLAEIFKNSVDKERIGINESDDVADSTSTK